MKTVCVFSGTSEGRQLIEALNKKGIFCHAFVATEYGEAVMEDHPLCQVHVGRLSIPGIVAKLQEIKPRFVFDATHPYAKEITVNIKQACRAANMPDSYIRVSRQINKVDIKQKLTVVSSYQAAVARIREIFSEEDIISDISSGTSEIISDKIKKDTEENLSQRNILLTTGVKELSIFSDVNELKERLVVRILPGVESLEAVRKCGIPPKHIVAMEGPFGLELNLALIRHFNAKVLVTKNSGSRGGFEEKLEAARLAGIEAIVIDKELSEAGISIEEAVEKCLKCYF